MLQCETESERRKKTYKINQSLPLQMPDYFFNWSCIQSSVKCPKDLGFHFVSMTSQHLTLFHHS